MGREDVQMTVLGMAKLSMGLGIRFRCVCVQNAPWGNERPRLAVGAQALQKMLVPLVFAQRAATASCALGLAVVELPPIIQGAASR